MTCGESMTHLLTSNQKPASTARRVSGLSQCYIAVHEAIFGCKKPHDWAFVFAIRMAAIICA